MIDEIRQLQNQVNFTPGKEPTLIDLEEIKAILYMGLRGQVALPLKPEEHQVDILA